MRIETYFRSTTRLLIAAFDVCACSVLRFLSIVSLQGTWHEETCVIMTGCQVSMCVLYQVGVFVYAGKRYVKQWQFCD